MKDEIEQLIDWLLTNPINGERLHFAGAPEKYFMGLTRVMMQSQDGSLWTLTAGLKEGYQTESEMMENIRAAAKEAAEKDAAAPQQAGDRLTDEQIIEIAHQHGKLRTEPFTHFSHVTLLQFARAILAAPRQPGEMGAGVQMDDPQEKAIADAATMKWMFIDVMAAFATGNRLTERLQAAYDWCERSGMVKKYQTMAKAPAASAQQDEREAVEKWAAESPATPGERNAFIDGYRRAAQQVRADAGAVLNEDSKADLKKLLDSVSGDCYIGKDGEEALVEKLRASVYTHPSPAGESDKRDAPELSSAEIEAGWHKTFSTSNPYCPCNLKSFTKAVRWAERAIRAAMSREQSREKGGERG